MVGPLPVPAEVHRRAVLGDQRHDAAELHAVAVPAAVFPEGGFLRVAMQVDAADVVVMPDLRPAETGEEGLRLVGARPVQGIGFLVVDPVHGVAIHVQMVVDIIRMAPVHEALKCVVFEVVEN